MTVTNTSSVSPIYTAATVGPFAFSFKTFDETDLEVLQTDTTGENEATLALTTDYSVSLNADQNNNPGGEITLTAAQTTGQKLRIRWAGTAVQETDVQNAGGFYPEVVEDALDRLTMLVQKVQGEADRAVKVDVISTVTPDGLIDALTAAATDAEAAATSAAAALDAFDDIYLGSKASDPTLDNDGNALVEGQLYWNSVSNSMRIYDGAAWQDTATATPASFTADTFSGNGSTTGFTLSAAPASVQSCVVFISGVRQTPTTDYTVSGTTLTFTSAPPSGTNNITVLTVSTLAAGVPDDGSVTTAKIADGAVTAAKMETRAAVAMNLSLYNLAR